MLTGVVWLLLFSLRSDLDGSGSGGARKTARPAVNAGRQLGPATQLSSWSWLHGWTAWYYHHWRQHTVVIPAVAYHRSSPAVSHQLPPGFFTAISYSLNQRGFITKSCPVCHWIVHVVLVVYALSIKPFGFPVLTYVKLNIRSELQNIKWTLYWLSSFVVIIHASWFCQSYNIGMVSKESSRSPAVVNDILLVWFLVIILSFHGPHDGVRSRWGNVKMLTAVKVQIGIAIIVYRRRSNTRQNLPREWRQDWSERTASSARISSTWCRCRSGSHSCTLSHSFIPPSKNDASSDRSAGIYLTSSTRQTSPPLSSLFRTTLTTWILRRYTVVV